METEQRTLSISVIWRGKKFILETNSGATLKEFGIELQKLTNVKADTLRLIVPESSSKSSKLLSPFSDEHSCLCLIEISIPKGKSIRMMGVSEDEVEEVLQNAKANLRIAGFDEEEKRLRQRLQDKISASLKLPQGTYIFCDFRALELPGIELNPPASETLKRMHMLAADPGIVAIMNKHHWRVGIMTEMAPVGYVGVSPKCILGFNKNHGEEISLRLRTDDLKGFRKYESIKKTLLHELAHMIFSEHDANFYALDKQLNEEAATLDWTKSRSHTLGRVKHSEHLEQELNFEGTSNFSHKLGGNLSDQLASARATSVLAACSRFVNASSNNSGVGETHDEPDPDDSGFNMAEDSGHMNSTRKEKVVMGSANKVQFKPYPEPDPDDRVSSQNELKHDNLKVCEVLDGEPDYGVNFSVVKSEPDIVDVEMAQNVQPSSALAQICEEPDPDDSLRFAQSSLDHVQVMKTWDSSVQMRETIDEPDPDDSEAKQNNLEHGDIGRHDGDSLGSETMEDQTQLSRTCVEPDPDDLSADGVVQVVPNPAGALVPPSGLPRLVIDEPDPDDTELRRIQDPVTIVCNRLQKAIQVLQSEVTPTEIITVLQTLFKIIRNLVEHPEEMKFKRLRMANPVFQKNIANFKAAREVLSLIGFIEDVISDEIGKAETYLVLKRNDPGLLWLVKSSLETCMTH